MKTQCCQTEQIVRAYNTTICNNADCTNYLSGTKMVRDFRFWKLRVSFSVFVFYLVFTFNHFSMTNQASVSLYKVPENPKVPLTLENLQKELEQHQVICRDEVMAQIRLESGNLTSFLLRRTNNMLGMRYPVKRTTTACGIYLPDKDTVITGSRSELKKYARQNNYAVYETWQHAVADYKLWQENTFKVKERYLSFLGDIYAEDSLYVQKIKTIALDQE